MAHVFTSPITVKIDQDGIYQKSIGSEGRVNWNLITRLEDTKHFFLFWLAGRRTALAIPRSAWPDQQSAMEFFNQAQRFFAQANPTALR